MSSEHSSKPLPELKGAVARKSPEILKIENSEHLVTSPISGPDNSLSSPAPSAQSKYIEMASTPPTMQRSNGLSDTVNDPESHTDTDDHVDSAEQHSASQDPAEKIKDFDWSALEKKHHEAMAQCLQSEQSLNEEFDQLVKYFQIWAGTTTHYETHRASNRLQTRISHVQNSERGLEDKRQHYVKVVQAFKRALELLNT